MKKLFSVLFLLLLMAAPLHASELDGRTDKGWREREGIVIKRGLLNAVSFPLEIFRTTGAEKELHPKLWPVTFAPRAILNTLVRITSTVHDVIFFPVYVPFTNDLSPWTEAYDLPDYAWQKP